jgi:hypothetical protein
VLPMVACAAEQLPDDAAGRYSYEPKLDGFLN